MKVFVVAIFSALFLFFVYIVHLVSVPVPQDFALRGNNLKVLSEKNKISLKLPPPLYRERIKKRVLAWKRDPFKISGSQRFIGEMKLEAISVDSKGRGFVMINGETYRENDVVGIYRIVKIAKNYIVVNKGGSNIIIKMEVEKRRLK